MPSISLFAPLALANAWSADSVYHRYSAGNTTTTYFPGYGNTTMVYPATTEYPRFASHANSTGYPRYMSYGNATVYPGMMFNTTAYPACASGTTTRRPPTDFWTTRSPSETPTTTDTSRALRDDGRRLQFLALARLHLRQYTGFTNEQRASLDEAMEGLIGNLLREEDVSQADVFESVDEFIAIYRLNMARHRHFADTSNPTTMTPTTTII
jgi:hypothetical protein